jgi:selenide,water dikinase
VVGEAGPVEDAALLHPENGSPLVFTVDFITPIVDDPETFGAIAAANALSDVYAMGGEPRAALAVCGFPTDVVPIEILTRILRGGRDKAAEAGCAIVGGHTVQDPELKYGLCVIGVVEDRSALCQDRARAGDRLILTKPLGFGIAAQAIKKGRLSDAQLEQAVVIMTTLNRSAKDAALAAAAHAATDVTGFGLLGHLHHLAMASGLSARVFADAVPRLEFVRQLAEEGMMPGGSKDNLAYVEPRAHFDSSLSEVERLILADAQTSGGLLIAVPPDGEASLLRELAERGTPARAVVGEMCSGEPGSLAVVRGEPS